MEACYQQSVCIHPDLQQKGIGSLLIWHTFKKARELGNKEVFIMGHPCVYNRFGFRCSKEFDIKDEHGNYLACLMALELEENYLSRDKEGTFLFLTDFEVDYQKFQEYYKQFHPK